MSPRSICKLRASGPQAARRAAAHAPRAGCRSPLALPAPARIPRERPLPAFVTVGCAAGGDVHRSSVPDTHGQGGGTAPRRWGRQEALAVVQDGAGGPCKHHDPKGRNGSSELPAHCCPQRQSQQRQRGQADGVPCATQPCHGDTHLWVLRTAGLTQIHVKRTSPSEGSGLDSRTIEPQRHQGWIRPCAVLGCQRFCRARGGLAGDKLLPSPFAPPWQGAASPGKV